MYCMIEMMIKGTHPLFEISFLIYLWLWFLRVEEAEISGCFQFDFFGTSDAIVDRFLRLIIGNDSMSAIECLFGRNFPS